MKTMARSSQKKNTWLLTLTCGAVIALSACSKKQLGSADGALSEEQSVLLQSPFHPGEQSPEAKEATLALLSDGPNDGGVIGGPSGPGNAGDGGSIPAPGSGGSSSGGSNSGGGSSSGTIGNNTGGSSSPGTGSGGSTGGSSGGSASNGPSSGGTGTTQPGGNDGGTIGNGTVGGGDTGGMIGGNTGGSSSGGTGSSGSSSGGSNAGGDTGSGTNSGNTANNGSTGGSGGGSSSGSGSNSGSSGSSGTVGGNDGGAIGNGGNTGGDNGNTANNGSTGGSSSGGTSGGGTSGGSSGGSNTGGGDTGGSSSGNTANNGSASNTGNNTGGNDGGGISNGGTSGGDTGNSGSNSGGSNSGGGDTANNANTGGSNSGGGNTGGGDTANNTNPGGDSNPGNNTGNDTGNNNGGDNSGTNPGNNGGSGGDVCPEQGLKISISRVCSVKRSASDYLFFEEAKDRIMTLETSVPHSHKNCIAKDHNHQSQFQVASLGFAQIPTGKYVPSNYPKVRLKSSDRVLLKQWDLSKVDLFKGRYTTSVQLELDRLKKEFGKHWQDMKVDLMVCDDTNRNGFCADEDAKHTLSVTTPSFTAKYPPQTLMVDVWAGRHLTRGSDPTLCEKQYSPVVLDLTGQGINLVGPDAGVEFDLNATGNKIHTGWVKSKTAGFLVRDLNGNKQYDSGAELFGNATKLKSGLQAVNGFEAMKDLDSNHDGILNKDDAAWSELRVWVDKSAEALTNRGESYRLSDLQIVSFNLKYVEMMDVDAHGNQTRQRSTYHRMVKGHAKPFLAIDVWFNTLVEE